MAEVAKKVVSNTNEIYEGLNGTQKCAILMMLIGEDEAAEIMGNLSPKEVQVLGAAMYSVQGLGQDTVNLVLDEFLAIIKAQTSLGISGGNYIKNVLTKSLGQDKAQSVLGKITPTDSIKAIEILDWLDARSITDLIIDEHPQIIALIISYLEPAIASDVLHFLPEKSQSDIIKRIATLQTVQPEALRELDRVMQKVFSSNASLRASKVGGVQAAAKIMTKQASGSIIHMSSQMGHIGAANRTVYCMTKHAIEGLTKAMAVELAPSNVRVNSVAPTFIETPLTAPMFENEDFKQDVLSKIPLDRIGTVEDIAAAVLYLASSSSNMVTGHSLRVDGGWTAL